MTTPGWMRALEPWRERQGGRFCSTWPGRTWCVYLPDIELHVSATALLEGSGQYWIFIDDEIDRLRRLKRRIPGIVSGAIL